MLAYSDRIELNFNSSVQDHLLLDPRILTFTAEKNYGMKKKTVTNVNDVTNGSNSTFITVRCTTQAFLCF